MDGKDGEDGAKGMAGRKEGRKAVGRWEAGCARGEIQGCPGEAQWQMGEKAAQRRLGGDHEQGYDIIKESGRESGGRRDQRGVMEVQEAQHLCSSNHPPAAPAAWHETAAELGQLQEIIQHQQDQWAEKAAAFHLTASVVASARSWCSCNLSQQHG